MCGSRQLLAAQETGILADRVPGGIPEGGTTADDRTGEPPAQSLKRIDVGFGHRRRRERILRRGRSTGQIRPLEPVEAEIDPAAPARRQFGHRTVVDWLGREQRHGPRHVREEAADHAQAQTDRISKKTDVVDVGDLRMLERRNPRDDRAGCPLVLQFDGQPYLVKAAHDAGDKKKVGTGRSFLDGEIERGPGTVELTRQ